MKHKNVASIVGLVLTLVGCLVYLSTEILATPISSRPQTITVELERTGGLYEGSAVAYRGLRVGRVSSISLTPTGAEATLRITSPVDVPADTAAEVRSLSPVGEQFLDLQPASEGGPFLASGDRISGDAVDVPVSLASATGSLDRLLQQVDADDVQTVLTELAAATEGSQASLESLLDSTDELVTALDDVWPETRRLLTNGRTTLRTLAGSGPELRKLSRSAKLFAAFLRNFDPEFRDILEASPQQLATTQLLVRDLRRVLPDFTTSLHGLTDILAARTPHVRELLDMLTYGTSRFGSAFRDGYLHINLNIHGVEQCSYHTKELDPKTTKRRPLQRDGHCPMDSLVAKRGAQHAPGPVDYKD
ncbi:MlaD family protein [Nocardioides massiliensis]|uniref:Phospholipid/cholesterol/gamma-HCH transport system substrate-binding protein n=1 Tax=Nocardioides massiliensis TaxID=1325935 RepID=A0ABT9NS08_9ACTN|nr:MlaD family protein [Nocardioides massiliensis]MDP9823208.1 phospholipid/cholesterol/gamma-HCH transport system substrate-binding protein [Nocardioides massiliensis]